MAKSYHAGPANEGPTLAEIQAGGFPMGGENLAVDLADTLITVAAPAVDLLADRAASDRFWDLHRAVLPRGWALPTLAQSRRLRDAIRLALDAAERGAALDKAALDSITAFSTSARISVEIAQHNGRLERIERWHCADPRDLTLAAAARSAIDVLTLPFLRSNLRRCASPTCSMLYVGGDSRRRWCTPNICGNRDRAARHYRRHIKERS